MTTGSTILRTLDLDSCDVSDATIGYLVTLGGLEELDLQGTKVSSEGLQRLAELPNLRELTLSVGQVADDALDSLRISMPACEIRLEESFADGADVPDRN